MRSVRRALAILFCLAPAPLVQTQELVFATSDPVVSISSTFTGETMTLFGNIGAVSEDPDADYEVVVTVRGPVAERVVRRKTRQMGIVLNSDHALFSRLPSFYQVMSSGPLATIMAPEARASRSFTVEDIVGASLSTATGDPELFKGELIRLMEEAGLFLTDEQGVALLSPTLFATRIELPANIPNGVFLAHALILRDGEIVADRTQRFFVQTGGFERFLADAARGRPLLYGLACVALALFTGWLGGVVFRR